MAKDVYLESRVMAADPVELIHILYEHGLVQLRSAREALAKADILGSSRAISKTLAILGELEGSLDFNAGGSISRNLGRLYQYMRRRLVDGNAQRQDEVLAEVESLMRTLDAGWTAMQHATSLPSALPYSHAVTESAEHTWSA